MTELAFQVETHPTTSRAKGARPKPRVWLAGSFAAMAAPGGGETQLVSLARALRETGVDARLWRPWEDDWREVDCLHLVGSQREHLPIARLAKARGVAVVVSTVAWFDLRSYWDEPRKLIGRLSACARYAARAVCPRLPSWRRELYHLADRLLPNSKAEARQLARLFGVPAERITVVPNGADPRFATVTHDEFLARTGLREFVLYAGRIEPRKNQLGFLRAMRGARVPIVVMGDAVPGSEWYAALCRREADSSVRFIPRIDHDSTLLSSAYAAASCVALASRFETPGLVALEAGMTGMPLVLPEVGAAREYFGDMARYVRHDDAAGIRRAVMAAHVSPRDPRLATLVRDNYSWQAVAKATRGVYAAVV